MIKATIVKNGKIITIYGTPEEIAEALKSPEKKLGKHPIPSTSWEKSK